MGLIFVEQDDLPQAIELMQVLVDYECELGHPDAEKDAELVEQLRQRLAQEQGAEVKPKQKRKRKKK